MRTYKPDHRNPRRLRYGWRLSAGGHIMVDPAQRECVYLILYLRHRGHTLRQICEALSAAQQPAPRHTTWYCTTVKKIIEQNAHLMALLPYVQKCRDDRWQTALAITTTKAGGSAIRHAA
ncbi:MAG: hypothetical protein WD928_15710 [Gammaproteobacteria bacterium]